MASGMLTSTLSSPSCKICTGLLIMISPITRLKSFTIWTCLPQLRRICRLCINCDNAHATSWIMRAINSDKPRCTKSELIHSGTPTSLVWEYSSKKHSKDNNTCLKMLKTCSNKKYIVRNWPNCDINGQEKNVGKMKRQKKQNTFITPVASKCYATIKSSFEFEETMQ
jgi:hypothetical protein